MRGLPIKKIFYRSCLHGAKPPSRVFTRAKQNGLLWAAGRRCRSRAAASPVSVVPGTEDDDDADDALHAASHANTTSGPSCAHPLWLACCCPARFPVGRALLLLSKNRNIYKDASRHLGHSVPPSTLIQLPPNCRRFCLLFGLLTYGKIDNCWYYISWQTIRLSIGLRVEWKWLWITVFKKINVLATRD